MQMTHLTPENSPRDLPATPHRPHALFPGSKRTFALPKRANGNGGIDQFSMGSTCVWICPHTRTRTHTQRIVAGTYATYATVCHCIALGAFVPRSASIAFLIGGLTTATPTQAQCTHRHTHTHKQRQLVLQYKARPCASRGIKRFLTCSRATPATRGASKQREINCWK